MEGVGGRQAGFATARAGDQDITARGGDGNQPTESTMFWGVRVPWEDSAKSHRWDGSLYQQRNSGSYKYS